MSAKNEDSKTNAYKLRNDLETNAEGKDKPQRQFFLKTVLLQFHDWKNTLKNHYFWSIAFSLFVFILGFLGNTGLTIIYSKFAGTDHFLQQLSENQKQEFSNIRVNLKKLRGSIDASNQDAFYNIKNAVDALQKSNASLINQLSLAKEENGRLQQLAKSKKGIEGGYDFLLHGSEGIRLDRTTMLGMDGTSNDRVMVNVSSRDRTHSEGYSLAPGQSVPYKNASDKPCRISVVSVQNNRPGAAAFALSCINSS